MCHHCLSLVKNKLHVHMHPLVPDTSSTQAPSDESSWILRTNHHPVCKLLTIVIIDQLYLLNNLKTKCLVK